MNYNGFNTFQNPNAGPFPVSPGPIPVTPNNYQQMPTFQNIAQPQNDFKWVQGIEGAKAYPVAPNAVVELWDSESQTIYIKSADRTGMPSIKTLDYTVRSQGGAPANSLLNDTSEETISPEEFRALKSKIEALESKVDNFECTCKHENSTGGSRKNNLIDSGVDKKRGGRRD